MPLTLRRVGTARSRSVEAERHQPAATDSSKLGRHAGRSRKSWPSEEELAEAGTRITGAAGAAPAIHRSPEASGQDARSRPECAQSMRRNGAHGTSEEGHDVVMARTIVRPADLRRGGITDKEARRVCRGLERLTYESYADLSDLTPEEAHLVRARAVVQRRPNVIASHVTAAVAWGLPVPRSALDRVHRNPVVGVRGNVRSGGIWRMHPRPVPPEEVQVVDGLAVTVPLRTVLECPRVLDLDWSVATADAALFRRLITPDALRFAAAAVRRVRGAQRIRETADLASHLAESPGESLARLRMRRLGWEPEEQVVLADVAGRPRVDFLVDGCLVVEFDGAGKYKLDGDPARAHFAEKERNDRITEAGFEIIHITWRELWDEVALARRLGAALERARARRR